MTELFVKTPIFLFLNISKKEKVVTNTRKFVEKHPCKAVLSSYFH